MTPLIRSWRLGALLLAAPPAAAAQNPPSPSANACAAAEHHQFDFWIGDWDVSLPNGNVAGRNRIEPILKGCALRESWTGARGVSGTSYNSFDRRTGKWHQTWVDDGGTLLLLDGEFADGQMVLRSAEVPGPNGTKVINRITWRETAPGEVRQLWEQTSDGGKTWTVAFDGRYRKRS
jgi:hypothetical protein